MTSQTPDNRDRSPSLLLVGLGDLGGLTLGLLTERPGFRRVTVAGRNMEALRRRTNLARLVATHLDVFPEIGCVEIDLRDVDRTAETLAQLRPDIICNCASIQSWRYISQLPREIYRSLDRAEFGPWLPMHLTTAHWLMQAVSRSACGARVVNAAFPDAVGPVLAQVGLAPMVGVGNVANVIPALRLAAAAQLSMPVAQVEVRLVAQHYFSHRIPSAGDSGGAPYHLEVRAGKENVSERIDEAALLRAVSTDFKRTGGAFRQQITAAGTVRVLEAMLADSGRTVHAPAPNGLPGGYPVRIHRDRVEVELPEGLTLDDAVELNRRCQRRDGIDRIEPDGTVVFSAMHMAVLTEMLGYECLRMPLAECEGRALELRARFESFRDGLSAGSTP